MKTCARCGSAAAALKRPKTGDALCRECFFYTFETEIHKTITQANLFQPGDFVAIAASGGKDSTVLAYIMKLLNNRHGYGLKLVLLSIDEGITGYRNDSLETVKCNEEQYGIPLTVLSYKELYGWTMDDIVKQIGRKSNCTFCGVFRRQALDRGAFKLGVNKMVTGHNADDIAETVIMNVLRGDIARLERCMAITTSSDGAIPRSKPFKYTYEKEIVIVSTRVPSWTNEARIARISFLTRCKSAARKRDHCFLETEKETDMYAHFRKLDYFSTECVYSPNAYRGHARAFLKDLESIWPTCILDIIHSGECMAVREGVKLPVQGTCTKCGYISSQETCKACVMLEGLNRAVPRLGIGKSNKDKVKYEELKKRPAAETRKKAIKDSVDW